MGVPSKIVHLPKLHVLKTNNMKTLLFILVPFFALGQVTPEQFAKGKTIGTGFVHSLSSAGYTLATAQAAYPRITARYGMPINVTTMSLDWACQQEAMYYMEDQAISEMNYTAGKYYYNNHPLKLPLVAASTSRSALLMWSFDLHTSGVRNNSTTDFAVFFRYPKDQDEAMKYLSYQYVFKNGLIRGNNSKSAANVGIQLGASTRPILDNLRIDGCGISAKLEFCLETSITNVNITSYGVYGFALTNGTWSGAANSNAQSNIVTIRNFRAYNSPGYTPIAALYCSGNHTISGDLFTFEGDKGSQSHIFYENTGGTGVNVFDLRNIYMEYAGCTKAAIRIKSGKGQYVFHQIRSSVVETDMPCLIEVEAVQVSGNWGALHVMIENSAGADRNKGKFRNIGSSAYPVKWYVNNYNMKNNTTFNSVDNFDTTVPGSYLPPASAFRFVKPL